MKPIKTGRVRDIYHAADDKLVIVASDRISAFDKVLPKTVPGKGKALTSLSLFWFNHTKGIIPNHIISSDLKFMPSFLRKDNYEGRAMLVKKLQILPYEFVVRGYIYGKMWDEYEETYQFCGENFRKGYQIADKLDKPILTISTKDEDGRDEFISMWRVADVIGLSLLGKIKDISLALYDSCYNHALSRGIIIADTKLEFGLDENGKLTLADEIFTPDSSRLWNVKDYTPGTSPKSYDKQLLRDWITENKIGETQYDAVPDEIYEKTSDIYQECFRKLLG
ncbi:MAG: phosphoribosylaminoimidazolesuccinocarboxamide synthase [Defluviitaleaceae bacterium]|nr:phosphoribosylaminoimidazolesuccinocarboxamide synthase [Defluviitaleaceae bacterium]